VPTVTPEVLYSKLGHVKIIDVRGLDEFNNELGHIPNAELATLGPQLDKRLDSEDKHKEVVFVCRSGKRSAEATKLAIHKGFEKVYNLQGGMLKWNDLRYPFDRDRGGS
jgi:sulfur dioxygenase